MTSPDVPWKQGYWKMGAFKGTLLQACGNKFLWRSLISLDYPDLAEQYNQKMKDGMDCRFGKFGKPREEIVLATGADEYNIELSSSMITLKGVLNEEGTKIRFHFYRRE